MWKFDRPIAVWAVPLAVLTLAVLIMAADPGGLSSHLRGLQYDAYQSWQPRPYEETSAKSGYVVRVLEVDRASLARFGPWPWPRAVLAKLTRELRAAGASIVVFDFPLDTADPDTPDHLASLLPMSSDGNSARAALHALPSPDALLAESFKDVRAVTGFALGTPGRAPEAKHGLAVSGAAPSDLPVPQFTEAGAPMAQLEAASAGEGAFNPADDGDGRLRTMPLVFRLGDKLVPSLDAEVMRLVSGKPAVVLRAEGSSTPVFGSRATIVNAAAGALDVPLTGDGRVTIYYSGANAERQVSAAALDDGTISAARLKDAVVYLAAPDAKVGTPLGLRNAAEVHAETMENILLDASLKDASSFFGELIFLLVAGAGMLVLFARAGVIWAGILAAVAIAGAQAFTWFLFTNAHLLLDSINPSFALAAAFAGGLATRAIDITRKRAELRRSFSDMLPAEALDHIARAPALLKLEGETRAISYLSCGIRGYATLLESFGDDPTGFTRLIGTVMSPLIEAAGASRGTIQFRSPERFAAFWNAPLDDSEHAIHACEAANRMTLALAQINEQLAQERRLDGTAFTTIEIGVGISTGPAIAGAFGASRNYSVTGECALIAERVRGLSAQYGPAIIVSEDARKAAERGFAFLEVDFIAAGPRDQPVKLYALLGNPLVRASPKFRALSTFHDHIFQSIRTQQWGKAKALIEQCRKLSGASPKLYDLHLARIAWYQTHPPGANWDGAFRPALQ